MAVNTGLARLRRLRLYINELAEILRTYGITVRLCADDLKMYAKILNPVDAEVLQMAVDRLVDWAVMADKNIHNQM